MKICNKITTYRDAGVKGGGAGRAGGNCRPPVMGRSVNPIPTRGADFACHITTPPTPQDFWTMRRLCTVNSLFKNSYWTKTDDRAMKIFKNVA